jgi:hypothetical protein
VWTGDKNKRVMPLFPGECAEVHRCNFAHIPILQAMGWPGHQPLLLGPTNQLLCRSTAAMGI